MEKNIIVRQISNPGLSFTENINDKIILMSEVVFQNQTQKMSYQQFQQYIIDRGIFSGSTIGIKFDRICLSHRYSRR